jgi:hypothetical protein
MPIATELRAYPDAALNQGRRWMADRPARSA